MGQANTNMDWIQDTEQCVMCGLCLPHCPTYKIFQNEGDAPRGRILLIKALAKSSIIPDAQLVQHLGTCLGCRQCETVCPAKVPFLRIMDRARQHLTQTVPELYKPFMLPWQLKVFSKYRRVRLLFSFLLRVYHRSGLRYLLVNLSVLKCLRLERLDAMVPRIFPSLKPSYRKTQNTKTIALFSGCAGEVFDTETLIASRNLLQSLGYHVSIPRQQNCCGALHQHHGDMASAQNLLHQNKQAFKQTSHVVSCASGCGIQLNEHAQYLGIKHDDIHQLLLKHSKELHFAECNQAISLHTPCTMQSSAVDKLLQRVPGLHVKKLKANTCCGFAGANFFTQAKTAKQLMEPFIEELAMQETSILLTSNVGCMLHFRQSIARHGLNISVMHPSVFLAKQKMD